MDAFLHDLGFQWGGAERVFAALCRLNRAAPVFFIAGNEQLLREHMPNRSLNRVYPHLSSNLLARAATPILSLKLPHKTLGFERLTISSYAMARWLPSPNPRLIYCHSPMRQVWHGRDFYSHGFAPEALLLRLFGSHLRRVDYRSTRKADLVVVPSPRVADIVHHTYDVGPDLIVPPPVDIAFFNSALRPPEDYFIWIGRIVEPVKKLSMLMPAFQRCPGQRLLVVGDGRDRRSLEKKAPPNVKFLGWRDGENQRDLLAKAQALLLPSMEDFGMVAAESMSVGTPVILTEMAGAAHWIRPGVDGHVINPTIEDFAHTISHFQREELGEGTAIRAQAMAFHPSIYDDALRHAAAELGWR